ncbi:flagellar biosynthesis/type III secretory pathway chaperone [Kushneria sinocarnis]|uniref:Flagellar biosynthesis/type III secretory pathway chaperone n=1 Tax=Kushneria sinocarnis TaxID=595502 RepID=A0A420WXX3_9GAMM|nr:flagellar protein FlgN [Kushneria sinocarnis]RKR06077.1 flagellar biosynthesis/type III secretory pathway chaperone [Kushneria sinocarnis]
MSHDPAVLLTQLLEALERFNALLDEESALLADTPVAAGALADVTERKSVVTATLERLEGRRCQWLQQQGFSVDRSGSRAAAHQHELDELWQQIVAAGEQARTRNRLNGLAIHLRLDMHERALRFFKTASSTSLYGRNGRSSPVSQGNTYGQC